MPNEINAVVSGGKLRATWDRVRGVDSEAVRHLWKAVGFSLFSVLEFWVLLRPEYFQIAQWARIIIWFGAVFFIFGFIGSLYSALNKRWKARVVKAAAACLCIVTAVVAYLVLPHDIFWILVGVLLIIYSLPYAILELRVWLVKVVPDGIKAGLEEALEHVDGRNQLKGS